MCAALIEYAALIESIDQGRLVNLVGALHKRSKLEGHPAQGNRNWHADTHTKAGIESCLRRHNVPKSTLEEIMQEQQRAGPPNLDVGAWVECYARAPMGAEFGAYIGVGVVSRQCLERGQTLKIGLLDKSTDRVWQRWHIDNIAFKQQIELVEVCCKPIGPEDISAALCKRLTTLERRFEAETEILRLEDLQG
jgi:hypothetical protein